MNQQAHIPTPATIRRKLDETFGREALHNRLSSGNSATAIGRELGLAPKRLYAWKQRFAPGDAEGRAAPGAKSGALSGRSPNRRKMDLPDVWIIPDGFVRCDQD